MREERKADRIERVAVDGYEVVSYSFGDGEQVLFCLNGGPGMACDYVRDSHSRLADEGYRVVCYDQLGCGESDKPEDPGLWTLERYVREAELWYSVIDERDVTREWAERAVREVARA